MNGRGLPEVTVVIPVWDRYCAYLHDAVDSGLDQRGVAVRVLVVDNASGRPLPELPPQASVVRAPRRSSVGAARNLGLAAVESPFVCFLDADDVLLPGALSWLVSELDTDAGLVTACGRGVTWDGETGETRLVLRAPRPVAVRVSRHRRLFALANLAYNTFPVVGCVHRTAAVRAAGGFAEADVAEDWVLGAMLCARGRVLLTEQPAFLRRLHGGSLWYRDHDAGALLAARAVLHERVRRDPAVGAWTRSLLPVLAWLHGRSVRRAARHGVVAPERPQLATEART